MKRHALLIVNGSFPNSEGSLGSLSTVMDDLVGMQRVLNKLRLPPFTVIPVVNGLAVDIDDKLEQILTSMDTEEDLLLVYYAGHGRILKTPGKADSLLLATFGSRKKADNRYIDFEYSKIEEKLGLYKVRRAVIVLDCCYSGAAFSEREFRGETSIPALPSPFSIAGYSQIQFDEQLENPTSQKDMGDGIYIFTACAANEQAAGNTRTRSGEFTGHLIEALESARDESSDPITLQAVFQTVYKAMSGQGQTPSLIKREGKSSHLVLAPREFLGEKRKRSLEDWEPQAEDRLSRLDSVSPMYLLDAGFRFLHWNAMFEDVIAKQLGLVIGCHALEFINGLGNDISVSNRNPHVFPTPSDEESARAESTGEIWEGYPTVDIERLDFVSDRFGLIVFNKLAIKIREPNCRKPTTWQIDLNARFVQHHKAFWKNAKEVVEQEALWSTYANTYDAIVGKYPKYLSLIGKVVGQVGNCRDCLEIGAGTGNTTIALLLADKQRKVTAIESNDAMLSQLSRKLADYNDRVKILKGDATTVLRRMYQERIDDGAAPEIFDSCAMTNALFALSDPGDCLKALYRILKPGGILSISTPHSDVPVDVLMSNICEWQTKKNPTEWAAIDDAQWESTLLINKKLGQLAADRKFDLAKIKQLLTDAQFQIVSDPVTVEYDGSVVVVKAIKPIRVIEETITKIIDAVQPPATKTPVDDVGKNTKQVVEHPRTRIKLFISYARRDSRKVEEFLAALEENIGPSRNYQYEIWKDDQNVVVGERWHEEIQRAVADCDVGLLLVSPLFLTSEYIRKEELYRFMYEQPKPIIPVLLKDVDFVLHELKGIEHTQVFALYNDSNRQSYVTCRGNRKAEFVRELFRQLEERITKLRLGQC